MSIVQYIETVPRLKEKLASLKESFSNSPQILSLTGFILKQKMVTEDDYLLWAQKEYSLPWLKTDFFHLHSPEPQVWQKWKDFCLWRPDYVPLIEWDGVLFVGCLEKPTDWPENVPVCFVLSSLTVLESWFKRYDLLSEQPVEPEQPATPQPPPPPPPPAHAEKKVETLELVDTPEGPEGASENSDVELLEGFENITGGAKSPVEIAFASVPPKPTPKIPEPPVRQNTISQAVRQNTISQAVRPNTVSQAVRPHTVSQVKPNTVSQPVKTNTSLSQVVKSPLAPKAPPPPPSPSTPMESNTSPALTNPRIRPASGGAQVLAEMLKRNSALPAQLKVICDPMKNRFQKYMLLSVSESGDEIIPVLWTENFNTGHTPGSYVFPIPNPCIFKIVSGTMKPFHGYITPNETNEKFFEDWMQGQIPDHVTIVPIIVKDQMIGMVMAIGEQSCFNLPTLKFTEKIAAEIQQKMAVSSRLAA